MKTITLLLLLTLVGCRSNDKTFQGPWAGHAQAAWNHGAGGVEARDIQVHKPSPLKTHFVNADGVLGGGPDRYPYVNKSGGKVGGWHIGSCRGGANAYLVKMGDFFNLNIGTHEVCHHVNHHARCDNSRNGHPTYLDGIAPHWPYWRGSFAAGHAPEFVVTTMTVEQDGLFVCVLYIDDPIQPLSVEIQKEREAFALELLESAK